MAIGEKCASSCIRENPFIGGPPGTDTGSINETPKAFHHIAWLLLKICAAMCIKDHGISVEDVDAALSKNDLKTSHSWATYPAAWFY